MALLALAQAALPDQVEAATVDHGLRSAARAEAEFVAAACQRLGVPHVILPVTVAHGNVQAEARRARYAALAAWMAERELAVLATAHHADDQAETLLLRLNRGAGVAGLAGVRAKTKVPGSALPLVRPLLGWRRTEMVAIAANSGLGAVADPSNSDPRFDRVRMREALAQADWLDRPALATSAANLADADLALEWAAAREWSEAVSRVPLGLVYRPQAPKAIALRVLARIVAELDGEAPRGSATARLFTALLAREAMSIGSLVARVTPEGWSFTKAPQRRKSG